MNIKKYLIGAGLTAAILTGVTTMALADNDSDKSSNVNYPPMVIDINSSGKTLLRGTIKSIGASSLTVTSWGGEWVMNISGSTKLLPNSDMSQFKVGDFVGAHGTINQGAAWTIDATLVRNWSAKKENITNRQEIREFKKSINPRNWQGTASDVNNSNSSLTLTIDGTAYTVNMAAGAQVVNKHYAGIVFSDIKSGDTVRVWGPATNTIITAYVVRDVSIE